MRRQVSSVLLQEQVQEMIDRVCSQYAGEETWINIEQLEVDLGAFSDTSFYTAFAPALLLRLEKALAAKLEQAAASPLPVSRRHSEGALLQYLLLHGVLPWWGTAGEPDLDAICAAVIRHAPESFTRFLWQQRFNRVLWQRIVYQLNAESKARVIGLLPVLSAAADYLQEWIDNMYGQSLFGQSPGAEAIRSMVQKIILENAPRLLQSREARPAQETAGGKEALPPAAEMEWLKSLLLPGDEAAKDAAAAQEAIPDAANDHETEGEAPEKYFIKTAGIVLLAPFFKPFFTALGLLEGNEWTGRAAAHRAVHLLKFLGTGLQRQPEYSLVLEKICCSLPPAEPVPLNIDLEEKEVQEAEQLLAAVIAHWRALKNTSVNGLRESFLKRDAILTRRENGWLLQVERKTPDVLLDSLPWGYGAVRLPWNDDSIIVEW